jgi:hypothetical protein
MFVNNSYSNIKLQIDLYWSGQMWFFSNLHLQIAMN